MEFDDYLPPEYLPSTSVAILTFFQDDESGNEGVLLETNFWRVISTRFQEPRRLLLQRGTDKLEIEVGLSTGFATKVRCKVGDTFGLLIVED